MSRALESRWSGKEGIVAEKKAEKRTTPKKSSKKQVKEGEAFKCTVCGLAITVNEECGCVDACDIICCEQQMKPVRKRARA